MIRTQIQLTEQQTQRLKMLAKQRGVSMAQLIRQSVDNLLNAQEELDKEAHKRRALSIIGMFQPDAVDLSINHDAYLEEAYGG